MPGYREIADYYTQMIADGAIKPDEYLPSQSVASRRHRASRSTITNAYDLLKERGLVVGIKGAGVMVVSQDVREKVQSALVVVPRDWYEQAVALAGEPPEGSITLTP